jgi:hypothetical protein
LNASIRVHFGGALQRPDYRRAENRALSKTEARGSLSFFQVLISATVEEVGVEVRTAGDRTRRRRLNKLSCADWLPAPMGGRQDGKP